MLDSIHHRLNHECDMAVDMIAHVDMAANVDVDMAIDMAADMDVDVADDMDANR
jgi:hypothetical protein